MTGSYLEGYALIVQEKMRMQRLEAWQGHKIMCISKLIYFNFGHSCIILCNFLILQWDLTYICFMLHPTPCSTTSLTLHCSCVPHQRFLLGQPLSASASQNKSVLGLPSGFRVVTWEIYSLICRTHWRKNLMDNTGISRPLISIM